MFKNVFVLMIKLYMYIYILLNFKFSYFGFVGCCLFDVFFDGDVDMMFS